MLLHGIDFISSAERLGTVILIPKLKVKILELSMNKLTKAINRLEKSIFEEKN